MNRAPAVILLGLLPLLSFACSGGDDAPAAGGAAPATSVAAPTPIDPSSFIAATPQTLPVTPVSIHYFIADPAFEGLPGARAIFGQNGGAAYQIEVPDSWNGDVVYFAHGFRGSVPDLTVTMPPLRQYLIERGFAWAASSYSANGYEPGIGARDTYALRDIFAREVGQPRYSYIYGQSMGGHIAAFSLERYPDAYDGALSECGVVSGHEVLDYFLSWGALAGYFTGTDLGRLTAEPAAFADKISREVVPGLGALEDPTEAGRAFVSVIEHLTGGPRPYFREGLTLNYSYNFVILANAVASAGPANAAAQNLDTVYTIDDGLGVTNEQLNSEVIRVQANPQYRDGERYPEFADLSGKISSPMLTLHNTGDLFVPISVEQSYRRAVDAAGNGDLLVQRAIRRPGHCSFSEREQREAFDDLVGWVERGEKPAGEDLLGDLSDAGRAFTLPLGEDDPGGLTP